jgi:ADP-ribose pyrophosphatase YjhB (NUDIX family)
MAETVWHPHIAVTCIIRYKGKYLILKRLDTLKKWPGKWTFPGGKVIQEDFIGTPTTINNQWYKTLEFACMREIEEETGINKHKIGSLRYLCNIAIPDTLIVSFVANLRSDEIPVIKVQETECSEYKWVTLYEAYSIDLIDGLLHELQQAEEL